jgi:DnaJ-class molecular chaperone
VRHLIAFALFTAAAYVPDRDVTVTADLAAEGAQMVVRLRQEPTPVSDECSSCGGSGVLGDGRIKIRCEPCGGTGKRKTDAAR